MKRKLFFASVALAAVLVGCSKEEFTNVDNQLQELGDRPMVEAPVVTVGGAETKMTTSGSYAGVKWQAGDGFGAAVMDVYNGPKAKFEDMFTVVDYINSNVLFATEDGSNFYADASMPEGNHLFYAPFNKENISRAPLATQLPVEQVVANPSSSATAPSNDIIKAFYEDGTSPVFVAYEKIFGEAKTTLDLQMRHIYSLPLVTLKLGDEVQLYVDGELNVTKDADDKEVPVYESKIVVDSIVFQPMATKGAIKNSAVKANLSWNKDETALVWDKYKYETAKTSDIVTFETDTDEFEKVVVKFDGGQELTADKNGYFFMVLPGATYAKADLAVYVYATIDGEHYVSASNVTTAQAIAPAKDVRLLPGLPYSADEYNADGTMKASKGTSMTYVVNGKFSPTATPAEVSGTNIISNYNELTAFITNVAYRGEELVEVTEDWVKDQLALKATKSTGSAATYVYDPQKHFVINIDVEEDEDPIALDDAFVAAFEKACVISGESASIKFLDKGESKNVVLGNITWDEDVNDLFKFDDGGTNVWANGTVVLEAVPGIINTMAGAEVTLESEDAVTVKNNSAAIVNINSEAAHNVASTAGTVNVLVSTEATVKNSLALTSTGKALASKSTLNIADGVIMTGNVSNETKTDEATTPKTHYAEVTVNNAVVTIDNDGIVTVNSDKAKLTVTGNGSVDNTIGGVVKNDGNTVYATVSTFKDLDEIYDELCGLNKLVVTGSVENCFRSYDNAGNLILPQTGWAKDINTIDFNTGSSLAMGNGDWNWTGIQININDNVTWMGRDASVSTITVSTGNIKVANKKKLNIVDVNVFGYQMVASTDDQLETALINGGNVTLAADLTLADHTVLDVATTIDLNGKTLTGSIEANANLVVKNGYIENNNTDHSGIQVNGTSTLTLDDVNIVTTRHAVRVESTGAVVINGGVYEVTGGAHGTQHALNIGSSTVDANVTVNGGKFIGPKAVATVGNGAAVCVQGKSKLTINGGEFSGAKGLEGIYVATSAAEAEIVCKGGQFINFNPACNNNDESFVADDYTVTVSRKEDGKVFTGTKPSTKGDTTKNFEAQPYCPDFTGTMIYKVVAAE